MHAFGVAHFVDSGVGVVGLPQLCGEVFGFELGSAFDTRYQGPRRFQCRASLRPKTRVQTHGGRFDSAGGDRDD
jgi:hypothetical protein